MEGSLAFLFAALAVTWIVVFLYLVFLHGRLASLRRELDALERREPRAESRDRDALV